MTSTPSPAHPLSCADIQELLPDFCTDELDAPVLQAIERHSATCESCSREIAGWKQATDLVKRAATSSAAPIAANLRAPVHSIRVPYLRPLALAASLALAFGLGLFSGRSGSNPSASSPVSTFANSESIANRYRHAAAASPNTNSLGLALLSIARRD